MNKLKPALRFAPRDWKSLVISIVCLLAGINCLRYDTLFNHIAGGMALFASGGSFWASIFVPHFNALHAQAQDLAARWQAFQPEEAAKHFRNEILEMQRRGEIPESIRFRFGHEMPSPPANRKLN